MAAVLSLAGWDRGATLARSARDEVLSHGGGDGRALLVDLRHRVEGSRLLRWSLAGVGVVSADLGDRLGLPEDVVGDCRDRLLRLLDRATAAADVYAGTLDEALAEDAAGAPAVPVDALGAMVRGSDLSVARLVVATLGSPAGATEAVARA